MSAISKPTVSTGDADRSEATSRRPTISVVIPVYGSAGILATLHERLAVVLNSLAYPYEIIYVDDCSPDDAWTVLQRISNRTPTVHAIQLMRNSGQSNATLCGMAVATGELIITMDDDLQHPPEEIPKLVSALQPDVDVVMGAPRLKKHNAIRRLGSQIIHYINCFLLDKDPRVRFTSFRLLRRPVVDGLLTLRTLTPALGPMINSVSHRIVTVTTEHSARAAGRSNYTPARVLAQTLANFVGYSMFPLRLLAIIGLLGIFFSIILGAIYLFRYLFGGIAVPGWTTLALLLTALSGFNFFAFAILGEYVLRILQRVNGTPQFLVRHHLYNPDSPR